MGSNPVLTSGQARLLTARSGRDDKTYFPAALLKGFHQEEGKC